MAKDPQTYQPHWEERKERHKHHHHHHYDYSSSNRTSGWGGFVKLRDRQAYYGFMLIILGVLGYGGYKVVKMYVDEWRAMPKDDPSTEMRVDELRIRKVDEQDALQLGDSLAQAYNIDSIRHTVQIDTRPVYRPPKREDKWYITKRDWYKMWQDYKIMKWERKQRMEYQKEKEQEWEEAQTNPTEQEVQPVQIKPVQVQQRK